MKEGFYDLSEKNILFPALYDFSKFANFRRLAPRGDAEKKREKNILAFLGHGEPWVWMDFESEKKKFKTEWEILILFFCHRQSTNEFIYVDFKEFRNHF